MAEVTSRQSTNSWAHPGSKTFANTSRFAEIQALQEEVISLPDTCGKGTLGQIDTALLNFFTVLKSIKKYTEVYVLGTINKINNITSLISQTADIIGSILKILIQRLRNWLLEKIRSLIEQAIEYILPSIATIFKDLVIDQVVDQIICAFDKIIEGLTNFVVDFLFAFVQEIVNPVFCAVEGFTNSMINSLAAMIDEQIQPILDQIQDVLGGVVTFVGSVFEAIDYILGFEAFLCQQPNCPEIKSFKQGPWGGPSDTAEDDFNKFLEVPTSGDIVSGADQALADFFGPDSSTYAGSLNCNTDPYACGLPEVSLFGGGGSGAAGLAIVNSIGEVVGVDLLYPGTNYTSPPFVTFSDSCNDGNYASAHSVINDNGEVTEIIIDNPGGGYSNGDTGQDEFGNNITPSPTPTPGPTPTPTPPPAPTPTPTPTPTPGPTPGPTPTPTTEVREYVGCLTQLQIISTGVGYTVNDEIVVFPEIPNLEANVKLNPQGQIISIDITNVPCDITETPKVIINSQTGSGAIIKPILKFTKVKTTSVSNTVETIENQTVRNFDFDPQKVIRVIDCISR